MPFTDKHPAQKIDPNDGGYASRKFWFSIGTSLLIFLAGMAAAKWAAVSTVFPEMIAGFLAVLATYCGANVGAKIVTGKHALALGAGDAADDANYAPLILPGQPVEQLPPDHDFSE